jgi:hypothetical protein
VFDAGDLSVGQTHHAIGHARDRGVVRDDNRGCAELLVDASDGLKDDDARSDVEGASVRTEQRSGVSLRSQWPLLFASDSCAKVVKPRLRPGRSSARSGVIGLVEIQTSATFFAPSNLE